MCVWIPWSSYKKRTLLFCGGATIPWQCADSLGGASIREGASNRDITVYISGAWPLIMFIFSLKTLWKSCQYRTFCPSIWNESVRFDDFLGKCANYSYALIYTIPKAESACAYVKDLILGTGACKKTPMLITMLNVTGLYICYVLRYHINFLHETLSNKTISLVKTKKNNIKKYQTRIIFCASFILISIYCPFNSIIIRNITFHIFFIWNSLRANLLKLALACLICKQCVKISSVAFITFHFIQESHAMTCFCQCQQARKIGPQNRSIEFSFV